MSGGIIGGLDAGPPANTTFSLANGTTVNQFEVDVADDDPLILDKSICQNDGGHMLLGPNGSECEFVYPVQWLGNFNPTGALSTTASCDPSGTYVVDPKGAVKFSFPSYVNNQPFTTGSTPETCVVQVWLYQ